MRWQAQRARRRRRAPMFASALESLPGSVGLPWLLLFVVCACAEGSEGDPSRGGTQLSLVEGAMDAGLDGALALEDASSPILAPVTPAAGTIGVLGEPLYQTSSCRVQVWTSRMSSW